MTRQRWPCGIRSSSTTGNKVPWSRPSPLMNPIMMPPFPGASSHVFKFATSSFVTASSAGPVLFRPSSRPLMCCRFAPDLVWPTRRANSLESRASYIWDAVYDCTCRYAPGRINGPRGRDLRRDCARLTPHIEAHHAPTVRNTSTRPLWPVPCSRLDIGKTPDARRFCDRAPRVAVRSTGRGR